MWLGCVGLWFEVRCISVWTAFVELGLLACGLGFQCAWWFAAERDILGDAYVRLSGYCWHWRKGMIGVSRVWRMKEGRVG